MEVRHESIQSLPDQAARRCSAISADQSLLSPSETLYEEAPLFDSEPEPEIKCQPAQSRSQYENIPWPLLATRLWMLELLAIYLGICSTTMLITLLITFDNKPIADWKFFFSLNTIISILGAISRVTVAFILSSCLGQHKWNWINRRHDRIKIFELFDEASRGPWGSTKLLWNLKSIGLPGLGALAMLSLLGFDPFLQALVSLRGELKKADGSLIALMPMATRMNLGDTVWLDRAAWDSAIPDYAMASAISSGIFHPHTMVSNPLLVNCPTSNCTWPDFASIAICSSCKDVSKHANASSVMGKKSKSLPSDENDADRLYNITTFSLSYGSLQLDNATSYQYNDDDVNMSMNVTFRKSSTYAFRDSTTFLLSTLFLRGPQGRTSTLRQLDVTATECAFSLCSQVYSANYSAGSYTAKVKRTLQDRVPDSYECDRSELIVQGNASRNCGDPDLYSHSSPRVDLQLRNPLDEKSHFSITQNAVVSMTEALLNGLMPEHWQANATFRRITQVNGSNLYGGKKYLHPPRTMLTRLVNELWTAPDLGEKMQNVATAMTNLTRNIAGDQVVGESSTWTLFFDVRWYFIVFPIALQVAAYAYFAAVVCQTGRSGLPVWKERLLPSLVWGIEQNVQDSLRSVAQDKRGLDKIAEETAIIFSGQHAGMQVREKT